jgi:hypothetical protein
MGISTFLSIPVDVNAILNATEDELQDLLFGDDEWRVEVMENEKGEKNENGQVIEEEKEENKQEEKKDDVKQENNNIQEENNKQNEKKENLNESDSSSLSFPQPARRDSNTQILSSITPEVEASFVHHIPITLDLDKTGFVLHYLLSGDLIDIDANFDVKVPLVSKTKSSDKWYEVSVTQEGVSSSYGSPSYKYGRNTESGGCDPPTKKRKIEVDHDEKVEERVSESGNGGEESNNQQIENTRPWSMMGKQQPFFEEAEKMIVAKTKPSGSNKHPYKIDLNLSFKNIIRSNTSTPTSPPYPNISTMTKPQLITDLNKFGISEHTADVHTLRARLALAYAYDPTANRIIRHTQNLMTLFSGLFLF